MPSASRTSAALVPRRPIGIVEALSSDHAKARGLIAEIQRDPSSAAWLYPQLAAALRAHDDAESDTLYRTLAKGPLRDQIERSRAQHAQLGAMLRRLDATPIEEPVWRSRFAQMVRALEAHLFVEESKVFAAARQLQPAQQEQLAITYRRIMMGRMDNPLKRRRKKKAPAAFCFWQDGVLICPPTMSQAQRQLAAAQPRAQQVAAVAQRSWWDKWFGGGKNLVMNPAARTWLAPVIGGPNTPRNVERALQSSTSRPSRFLGSPIRGVRRLASGARPAAAQCFQGPAGSFCIEGSTRLTNGARPLPLPPGVARPSRARQLGMQTSSQGTAAGEVHTDAFGNQYTASSKARRL